MLAGPARLRRVALGGLRVAAALVVALLLTEIAFRALGLGVPPRAPNNMLRAIEISVPEEDAPGLGRALRPGGSDEVLYPGGGILPDRLVRYRVNSHGFRDREYEVPKLPGVFRIAVLGDSVTFGTGVQHEETFPHQLEELLSERQRNGIIEVVNCGVYATNTIQQVALLEYGVLAFEPDLVLIASTVVDASGPGIAAPPRDTDSWEFDWIRGLGLTSGIWDEGQERSRAQHATMWLRRRSHVYDSVCHWLYGWMYGRIATRNYHADWAEGTQGRAAVDRSLLRAAVLSRKHGFALHVAMYPSLTNLKDDYPFVPEIETLSALCAQYRIPFHDLLPALRGLDPELLQVHPHDRHPNGYCNGVVARYLLEQLAPDLPIGPLAGN